MHVIHRILSMQTTTTTKSSKRSKSKLKPKGRVKYWNQQDPNFNYDPYLDQPELLGFSGKRRLGGGSKLGFGGNQAKSKVCGPSRINFVSSSTNETELGLGDAKRGEVILGRRSEHEEVTGYKGSVARIGYERKDAKSQNSKFLNGRDHLSLAKPNHRYEVETDGSMDLPTDQPSFEKGVDRVTDEESLDDADFGALECEENIFHIDTVGNPNLAALSTQPTVDPNAIASNGVDDVSDKQTHEAHCQEAWQDYMDNLSVDEMNYKLNVVSLEEDSASELGTPCRDPTLGLEHGEEWAQGFKVGLESALGLLSKSTKKILTKQLKAHLDKALWPNSFFSAPKHKRNKMPLEQNKEHNEDRRHSITIKGPCLFTANDAIKEMLSNPHRRQLRFPLINRSHQQKVIALAELYCLDVEMPLISQLPLRVKKLASSFTLPDAAAVEALIGRRPVLPASETSPQKLRPLPMANASAPPIDSTNVGHRLLSQMGWAPGQALGANEDGILDPIQVAIRRKRQGLGA